MYVNMLILLLLLLLRPLAIYCSEDLTKEEDDESVDSSTGLLQSNLTGVPVGRTFLLLHLLKEKLNKLHALDKITTPSPPLPLGCVCVAFYLCGPNGTIGTDTGIDIRYTYRRCTGDFEVCCYIRIVVPTVKPPGTLPTNIPTTQSPLPTIIIPTIIPPTIPITIPTTISTIPTTISTIPTTSPSTIPTTISTIPTTSPSTIPTTISTIPTTRPSTIPTTVSTVPTTVSTIPTTQSTTTTTTTTTPRPITYCYCVAVYQCVYAGGGTGGSGSGGTGMIDPRLVPVNTCTGAYVCCSYYNGALPAGYPQFVLPQQPVVVPQQPVVLPQQPIVVPQQPIVVPQPPAVLLPGQSSILPPIVIGQSCVCVLLSQCNLGYIPITGIGGIDPRLVLGRQGQPPGSCNSGSMCCRISQGSSSLPITPQLTQQPQLPATGFVQQNIAVPPPNIPSITAGDNTDIKNKGTPNACVCILMDRCAEGEAYTYDGIGAIDPRFGPCMSATHVCCRLQGKLRADIVLPSAPKPVFTLPPARIEQQTLEQLCGLRNTTYATSPVPAAGNAYFAEFPWMAVLLIRQTGSADEFQCGGSLISSQAMLTAAHCVFGLEPGNLIVRLGEWDTRNTNEPLPYQEVTIKSISVHPLYVASTLYNDVAVVMFAKPVSFAINVRPICLPAASQNFAEGTVCYASGWGRSSFGPSGEYQTILRKVDLPIIGNGNCQNRLRQTRLGPLFQLHSSFVCAGGEENKDTCYKDGGGPLVCQDPANGRFSQIGIVSWGIGCGDKTPGVYASVVQAQSWITQQLKIYGANT